MKRFTKIMALLAAMTVALAFAGCENFITGDSTDTDKNVATEWEHTDPENFLDDFLTFYSNGKFTIKTIYYCEGKYGKDVEDIDEFQGTYNGDTTKDGTIYGKMAVDTGGYKDIKGIISGTTMEFYYSLDEESYTFTRVK